MKFNENGKFGEMETYAEKGICQLSHKKKLGENY